VCSSSFRQLRQKGEGAPALNRAGREPAATTGRRGGGVAPMLSRSKGPGSQRIPCCCKGAAMGLAWGRMGLAWGWHGAAWARMGLA
jgi:hypothetical protein